MCIAGWEWKNDYCSKANKGDHLMKWKHLQYNVAVSNISGNTSGFQRLQTCVKQKYTAWLQCAHRSHSTIILPAFAFSTLKYTHKAIGFIKVGMFEFTEIEIDVFVTEIMSGQRPQCTKNIHATPYIKVLVFSMHAHVELTTLGSSNCASTGNRSEQAFIE